MALKRGARPLAQCLKCTGHDTISVSVRSLTISARRQTETETQPSSSAQPLDPFLVMTPRHERKLMREQKKTPIGSRRRRAAMQSTSDIPFTELPYQCFQEARQFLETERNARLEDIRIQRERIARLQDKVVVEEAEKVKKDNVLKSMRQRLEKLKILADINDPMVKKRFEDGKGDMNKPIYRHLADKKWRSYKRLVLMQRITQMAVYPDLLPAIDPIVETSLSFPSPTGLSKRRLVQHGDMVDSRVSEPAPILQVQPFDKGERLYTIAIVNPDVPDVKSDAFNTRCHFLACNVPISPTKTMVRLKNLVDEKQVVLPWLPAYAQKGLPYHRMAIFVMEQPPSERVAPGSGDVAPSQPIDTATLPNKNRPSVSRDGFSLRSLVQKNRLKPVGVDLFRTVWDEGTAGVMQRANILGWDVEFKRKRVEPLPYKRLKEERYR